MFLIIRYRVSTARLGSRFHNVRPVLEKKKTKKMCDQVGHPKKEKKRTSVNVVCRPLSTKPHTLQRVQIMHSKPHVAQVFFSF